MLALARILVMALLPALRVEGRCCFENRATSAASLVRYVVDRRPVTAIEDKDVGVLAVLPIGELAITLLGADDKASRDGEVEVRGAASGSDGDDADDID